MLLGLVKDINPKSTVAPEHFTDGNGTLFFTIDHGQELRKTDGTEAGTVLVDSMPDTQYEHFTAGNGLLFFTAMSGTDGYELWRSDHSNKNGTRTNLVHAIVLCRGKSGKKKTRRDSRKGRKGGVQRAQRKDRTVRIIA